MKAGRAGDFPGASGLFILLTVMILQNTNAFTCLTSDDAMLYLSGDFIVHLLGERKLRVCGIRTDPYT